MPVPIDIIRRFEGRSAEELTEVLPDAGLLENIPIARQVADVLSGRAKVLKGFNDIISGGDPKRIDVGNETARFARFFRDIKDGKAGFVENDILSYEALALKEMSAKEGGVRTLREQIQNRYGIIIETVNEPEAKELMWGTARLEPSPLYLQFRQLSDLKNQLFKIPPDIFKKLEITKIVMCGGIELDLGKGKQKLIAAVPVEGEEIYLHEVNYPFYHELFHRIDHQTGGMPAMGGMSYEQYKAASDKNKEWCMLGGEQRCDDDKCDEEQAEYARLLFNLDDPYFSAVSYKMMMTDPVKRAKLEQIKDLVFKWSDGRFNEQYWFDLELGGVDESYWPKP